MQTLYPAVFASSQRVKQSLTGWPAARALWVAGAAEVSPRQQQKALRAASTLALSLAKVMRQDAQGDAQASGAWRRMGA